MSRLNHLTSPRIWRGDDKTAYLDVDALYYEGLFYLFPTVIRTENDGSIFFRTAMQVAQERSEP